MFSKVAFILYFFKNNFQNKFEYFGLTNFLALLFYRKKYIYLHGIAIKRDIFENLNVHRCSILKELRWRRQFFFTRLRCLLLFDLE